jgi:hypothetical protein
MKNFCIQNGFISMFAAAFVFFVFIPAERADDCQMSGASAWKHSESTERKG